MIGEAAFAASLCSRIGPPSSFDSGESGALWSIELGASPIVRQLARAELVDDAPDLAADPLVGAEVPFERFGVRRSCPSIATRWPPAEPPITPIRSGSRWYFSALARIQRIAALQSWIWAGQVASPLSR